MSARARSKPRREAPSRSRARRKIDAGVARIKIRNFVLPGHEARSAEAIAGERVGDFLLRAGWSKRVRINGKMRWTFRIPTVCSLNGDPLPQRQWLRRRIKPGDQLSFLSRPLGGSGGRGKAIAGIIAAVALAVFAPWAGGLVGGFVGSAITAGIPVGGALMIWKKDDRTSDHNQR